MTTSPHSAAASAAPNVQDAGSWTSTLETWQADYPVAAQVVGVSTIIALALLGLLVARPGIRSLARKVTQSTAFKWDDLLIEANVLRRFSWMVPALIVLAAYQAPILGLSESVQNVVGNVVAAIVILSITGTLLAIFDAVQIAYRRRDAHRRHPIKGYLQLGKIFVILIGGIATVAKLVGAELGSLFVGMGAMTAVLMLVFKDTILAFVASIQITANDMIRIGDWVEVPSSNADGDVIDIALHTVKVQNWDKTISTIPTYELFSKSFKNWRGMQEGDGRRIKRHLRIDMSSARFLTESDIDRLKRISLLKDYLTDKVGQLTASNSGTSSEVAANQRRLTNLGTYRAYITEYLKSLESINRGMTFLVRQLQPTSTGLPIEIYIFTKTKNWVEYEAVQADIFDHLLAIIGEFDLRLFQEPSGQDLAAFVAE